MAAWVGVRSRRGGERVGGVWDECGEGVEGVRVGQGVVKRLGGVGVPVGGGLCERYGAIAECVGNKRRTGGQRRGEYSFGRGGQWR